MFTRTSLHDYENLCRLDVLGVADIALNNIAVHQNFKDQLMRSKDECYETGFI